MAKEAIGDNLAAEMVPFAFSLDDGGIEFWEAPFVFVPNLIARVADKLNEHHQYVYIILHTLHLTNACTTSK